MRSLIFILLTTQTTTVADESAGQPLPKGIEPSIAFAQTTTEEIQKNQRDWEELANKLIKALSQCESVAMPNIDGDASDTTGEAYVSKLNQLVRRLSEDLGGLTESSALLLKSVKSAPERYSATVRLFSQFAASSPEHRKVYEDISGLLRSEMAIAQERATRLSSLPKDMEDISHLLSETADTIDRIQELLPALSPESRKSMPGILGRTVRPLGRLRALIEKYRQVVSPKAPQVRRVNEATPRNNVTYSSAPQVSGFYPITEIDRDSQFAVLDAGADHGLHAGDSLELYRGGEIISSVRVTSTIHPGRCVVKCRGNEFIGDKALVDAKALRAERAEKSANARGYGPPPKPHSESLDYWASRPWWSRLPD